MSKLISAIRIPKKNENKSKMATLTLSDSFDSKNVNENIDDIDINKKPSIMRFLKEENVKPMKHVPERNPAFSPTRIQVIGVGGAGCNSLNRMTDQSLSGLSFLAIHSNQETLSRTLTNDKILLTDKDNTFGTGGNPEVGRRNILAIETQIREKLKGVNMLFITAGLGGGTGSGVAPEIAKIAKELDILTIGIVTLPFKFEGKKRLESSKEGLKKMEEYCDSLIVISNDQLMSSFGKVPITDAFRASDDILYHSVKTITDLMTTTSLINLDFADVYSVMKGRGAALIGIGQASGEDRAVAAANKAIESPLLEGKLYGATKMIVNIAGNRTVTIQEASDAIQAIEKSFDDVPDVIFGITIKEELGDDIEVTLIATSKESAQAGRAQSLEIKKKENSNKNVANDFIGFKKEPLNRKSIQFKSDKYDIPNVSEPKVRKITSEDMTQKVDIVRDVEPYYESVKPKPVVKNQYRPSPKQTITKPTIANKATVASKGFFAKITNKFKDMIFEEE